MSAAGGQAALTGPGRGRSRLVAFFPRIPLHVVIIVLALLWIAFALLTLVAGIVILFTGRYPRGLFEYVEGVIRWQVRVAGYAFLLVTDRYPPFRLSA